jgi:N-acyl-D-aspartate/D-glutamate deacylase
MLDLAIRDVSVLDGSGAPAFRADVAVRDGRIQDIGSAGRARREIDGRGAVLAPGFVDTHAHDDGAFLRHPGMEFKLAQGVTTVVSGNCGFSAIPGDPSADAGAGVGILAGLEHGFADLAGYFGEVMRRAPALNNLMLVGHNTVRALAMGMERRAPTAVELATMRDHVERAMEQGACGFSTGLIYRPGRFSATEEVVALAQRAAAHGGLYATHLRNESDRLLGAVEEALRIGRESGAHVHISHHKSAGRANWGKVRESLARVDRALAAGERVTLDVYPYTAGSGRMIEYFDPRSPSRELAEVIRIASCPAFREFEGRMLGEIAAERGIDVTDAVKLVLEAPRGDRTLCIHFTIDEADVETNLAHADMMVGSDGIPDLRGMPHPRLFGTFPRVLARYVRERGILSLEEAVRRMTSLPAHVFGLVDRGLVREGAWADLVLFDPATIVDVASYDDPKREPRGISLVVVNGEVAYESGTHTRVGSGKMLRYRRSAFGEETG